MRYINDAPGFDMTKSFREIKWNVQQSFKMTGHMGKSILITEGARTYSQRVPCQCGNCPVIEPYPEEMRLEDLMEGALE